MKCNSKVGAIKDRLHISQKYVTVLDEINSSLSKKEAVYSNVATEGHRIINELQSTRPHIPTPLLTNPQTPHTHQNGYEVKSPKE